MQERRICFENAMCTSCAGNSLARRMGAFMPARRSAGAGSHRHAASTAGPGAIPERAGQALQQARMRAAHQRQSAAHSRRPLQHPASFTPRTATGAHAFRLHEGCAAYAISPLVITLVAAKKN